MENHLIIGLGGTGGRVIAAFRKLMFERHNGEVAPKDIWLDYLYMDSSKSDLEMDGSQWQVMGKSVKLTNDSVLAIPASNINQYITNRGNYKYLAPWIGSTEQWYNIVNDPKIQEGAAGQKRRLGRLLFANNASNFRTVVTQKIERLRQNPDGNKVKVHVVCGLAGGTGSGSVVDVCAQIGDMYRNVDDVKVLLYLLLPEEMPNPDWATTDNYQSNGYVALTELSALDKHIFKPWNVGERQGEPQRLELRVPFYSAYLVTNENGNITFDVQKVVPSSIAEFIYQKTVAIPEVTDARDFFDRGERGENPAYQQYDGPQCYKYMSYGIKRLAVPEQEITEYFGYSFANQALLGMLYNNLSLGVGYVNEAIQNEDLSWVISRENKERWHMTRDYMCLSKAFLPSQIREGWSVFSDEYQVLDTYMAEVLADRTVRHNEKFTKIAMLAKHFYDSEFRSSQEVGQNGVVNFFEYRRKHSLTPLVNDIYQTIESDLMSKWEKGEKSLSQIEAILEATQNGIEAELSSIANIKDANKKIIAKFDREINDKVADWSRVNLIDRAGITNYMNRTQTDFISALKGKYVTMTWNVAYDFERALLEELKQPLQRMQSNVKSLKVKFIDVVETIEGEIATRCVVLDENTQSRNGSVIKHYDPNKARTICERAVAHRETNDDRISEIRSSIISGLGAENHNFLKANEIFSKQYIFDKVSNQGDSIARVFFADSEKYALIISDYEKLIGVNILEKLKEQYSGNMDELKKMFERLVKHAELMVKHSQNEINNGPQPRKACYVLVPNYASDDDFKKEVSRIIEASMPAGVSCTVVDGGRSNEIVVINQEWNLTPRYISTVEVLRNQYDTLMRTNNAAVARFETQLEDYQEPLPSLYNEDDATRERRIREMQKGSIPYLLLAKGMGILTPKEDPERGIKKLTYIPVDEDGAMDFEQAIYLAQDLERSITKVTEQIANVLKNEVEKQLKSKYLHVERQKELRETITKDVIAVQNAHGNNPADAVCVDFSRAKRQAIELIEKLNED